MIKQVKIANLTQWSWIIFYQRITSIISKLVVYEIRILNSYLPIEAN